jgi:hypothetical protein
LWEAEDGFAGTRLAAKNGSGGLTAYPTPQAGKCLAPGLAPDPAGIDRRRITAAVVNCRKAAADKLLNGKKSIPTAGYIDVFLVEPSIDRYRYDKNTQVSDRNDVYVEVISASGLGDGGTIGQITRRDVPRLIE